MADQQYLDLCRHILENGTPKGDRTGTGTLSAFGYQMRFDLQKGFPLLTTKRVPFHLIASELIWFVRGLTNIRFLLQNNNNIWNEWAFANWVQNIEYEGPDMTDFGRRALEDEEFNKVYKEQMEIFKTMILNNKRFAEKFGDLGPIYGKQWRNFSGVDQLKNAITSIMFDPNDRGMIVSAWNPGENHQMALRPCHSLYQFYVADNKLSTQLYQRSGDVFLGVPFNIACYSLLTHMVAHIAGLEVGEFIHTIGDAHIYNNHKVQVATQLQRESKQLPTLKINGKVHGIEGFEMDSFILEGYHPHPPIKGAVSV